MAIRRIIEIGDPGLRKHARPVETFGRRLHALLDDMRDTVRAADGAGLAAPQVGILRRVVVIDAGEGLVEMVNPAIVREEGAQIHPEGCLSIPGRRCTVKRPMSLTVRAQDRDGNWFECSGEGLFAVAVCHELDHLDGVLYIDKMIEDVTERCKNESEEE